MLFVIPAIIAFLLSALATRYLSQWARRCRIFMSHLRPRDIHKKPTPRVGGLAIVAIFTIIIIILNFIYPQLFATLGFPFKIIGISMDKRLMGVLLAGIVLVAIMAVDDYRGLNVWVKLASQILVWGIVVAAGVGITYLNNPFGLAIDLTQYQQTISIAGTAYHFVWAADLILLVWLVGMMNSVNFIDGADGLAGGIGVIGFIVLGILSLMPAVNQPAVAMISFVAAAVTLGFLIFNFYPAQIFLGDAGAMWLGYMLAVLSVISGGKLAALFLVLALPIIDSIIVVVYRIARGKNPFTNPDQTHIHHLFLRAGLSTRTSVVIIYIISAVFGLAVLITDGRIKWIMVIALAIMTIVFLIYLRYRNRKNIIGNQKMA